ncbi:hypothetical protein EV426DRAFT_702364 [Tirmania nivea]|nr:hypothetical protein EV426DRAFT_702364 [Tirmania nivea]
MLKHKTFLSDRWMDTDKNRIMTTHIVGDAWDQYAWDQFCKSRHHLQIKGIPAADFVIGDVNPADLVSDTELETFYRSILVSGDDTNALEYT